MNLYIPTWFYVLPPMYSMFMKNFFVFEDMSLLIILTSYQYLCCKTRLVVTLTSLASSWSHLSKIFSNPSLLFYYAARSSISYTYSCCTRSCIFWMCLYFSVMWCISKVETVIFRHIRTVMLKMFRHWIRFFKVQK